jgi:hypothetical protein
MRMKIKRIILWIVLLLGLVSCGPAEGLYMPNKVSDGKIQAVLIAEGGSTQVYRFTDGNVTCYYTENNTINTASGIWCK